MSRSAFRTICLGFLPACLAVCAVAAAVPAPADRATSPTASASANLYPGEWSQANFDPLPRPPQENQGVRVARVLRREELPGGPWATGDIGDYLLQNDRAAVIIKGENRPARGDGVPGTGNVVDAVLRDRMWDSLGGVRQVGILEDMPQAVEYNTLTIQAAPDAANPPFLAAFGVLRGNADILVVTLYRLLPHLPDLVVETRYFNQTREPVVVGMADAICWGALPQFVADYGVPEYTRSLQLDAHWLCGWQDDYCLGVVNDSASPMRLMQVVNNETVVRYARERIAPGQNFSVLRHYLLTPGDMAPVSELAVRLKKLDFGWVEGTLAQVMDKKPLPGAEVYVGRVDPDRSVAARLPWYGITRTDAQGRYRFALPPGEYFVRTRTVGRPLFPPRVPSIQIKKGQTTAHSPLQTDLGAFTFEVVDAQTSAPLPAKVSFEPLGDARTLDLGPDWTAQGARRAFYLKPGPNAVPLVGGKFKCTFSRGPEYEIVEREIEFEFDKPRTVRIGLRQVLPTPGMVSADMNLSTRAGRESRASAEDLVLAAAGEGVEWIFSGDLNRVTDLRQAIAQQGLGKWVRASAGVRLSYQYPRLFGEFYVFPVPAETPQSALDALADAETTPAQFFQRVRAAFPGALISIVDPVVPNTSYLSYYGVDAANDALSTGGLLSMDFDAVEVFAGKGELASYFNWQNWKLLMRRGFPKMPLASSRSASLYYEEVGYPRTYLKTGTDDPAALADADVAKALKAGQYFITNGPIVDLQIDGKSPGTFYQPPGGKFKFQIRISAAPWVPMDKYNLLRSGVQVGYFQTKPTQDIVRFPVSEESAQPQEWVLYRLDAASQVIYEDAYLHVEVTGRPYDSVLTARGAEVPRVFAITPPVLLDANGDDRFSLP